MMLLCKVYLYDKRHSLTLHIAERLILVKSFVSIELICRGSGNVYLLASCDCLTADQELNVASASNNNPIPTYICRADELQQDSDRNYFLVVIPQTQASQKLTFDLYKNNVVTQTYTKTLHPQLIKWKSRLAYRTKSDLAKQVRDYRAFDDPSSAHFKIDKCISAYGTYLLNGSVRLPLSTSGDIFIAAYSRNGSTISSHYTILKEETSPIEEYGTTYYRTVYFSLRLPLPNYFYLAVNLVDSSTLLHGFLAFESHEIEILRQKAHQFVCHAQIDPHYHNWFLKHRVSAAVLQEQKDWLFEDNPLFSIVVPLFNTPLHFFNEMLTSVLQQSYSAWELVLVNASPNNRQLTFCVKKACSEDPRLTYVELERNLGITLNTAKGIAAAQGDYICFFDHDDLIEPDLLFEYARAINDTPYIDVLYCDEDKLMPDRSFTQPFFKPDFSIDLLRNNNYICHMLTIRKEILKTIPLNSDEFDGAQDHYITLSATERTQNIHHVPKILYHWRIHEQSTAGDATTKPYATIAGIKAVQQHLDRLQIDAEVKPSRRPFTYDVTYKINGTPLVSIIVPFLKSSDTLKRCLNSVFTTTYANYEIVLVCNEKTKKTAQNLAHNTQSPAPIHILFAETSFSIPKAINVGVKKAIGEFLLFIDPNVETTSETWIEKMLGHLQRDEVGVVGARVIGFDNTIIHNGIAIAGDTATYINRGLPKEDYGYFALGDDTQNVSAVSSMCMMTKKSTFAAVNGFSENLDFAFSDIDYCLKVRERNNLIVFTPEVEVRSSKQAIPQTVKHEQHLSLIRCKSYMFERWNHYYALGDPYFNHNLCAESISNERYQLME